jgi:hypothetical protein
MRAEQKTILITGVTPLVIVESALCADFEPEARHYNIFDTASPRAA